jgi:hypothetical protein
VVASFCRGRSCAEIHARRSRSAESRSHCGAASTTPAANLAFGAWLLRYPADGPSTSNTASLASRAWLLRTRTPASKELQYPEGVRNTRSDTNCLSQRSMLPCTAQAGRLCWTYVARLCRFCGPGRVGWLAARSGREVRRTRTTAHQGRARTRWSASWRRWSPPAGTRRRQRLGSPVPAGADQRRGQHIHTPVPALSSM